ncbi:uncharacterized protein LOC110368551 [Fundulus heteroclitus]|uniref:uncharacterized protein LOC110368551 n=1 Tax=Fundulus heteroclitus TaxID=8078 RepID=UPI00165A7839|nr:uncharacterized protein LOC110368551 [Fundulus heteroclitus]
MDAQPLFGLYLILSVPWTSEALYSSDPVMVFAKPGDRVTLPCGLPSGGSCSSINWTQTFIVWHTDVVTAGKVTPSEENKFHLLEDCSLDILQMERDDARLYTCKSGALNSSVSLRFVEVNQSQTPAEETIELHCSLSTYVGFVTCKNDTGIHIKWTTEDDVPITGKRFKLKNSDICFSKLIITKKPTDHHRTWKCQVTQNDVVKATASYRTTVRDGVEEVFAAVGESVSLLCRNTSSLGLGEGIEWALNKEPLTDMLPENGQINIFSASKDSSLVISKLSPVHAGDYQCMGSSDEQRVFDKFRLHTLDVTAKTDPAGGNLTLTCVLTCAQECDETFNLTWSGSNQEGWKGSLSNVNNTLINQLFLPAWPVSPDELICSVYREGSLMTSKSCYSVKSLRTITWLYLLLGLLICAATLGVFIYWKRKRNKDPGTELADAPSMTHIYDAIQDEEVQQQRTLKREGATADDQLYNLLQAVN